MAVRAAGHIYPAESSKAWKLMSALLSQLRRTAADLNELHAPWALIGALACSVYSQPRTTRDIDVAIAVEKADLLDSLLHALESRGYGKPGLLLHASPARRLGFRLSIPVTEGPAVPLDLLVSSSGIEPEVVRNAVPMEVLPGVIIPLASLPHILAMKVLSQNDGDRVQDRADVRQLIVRATPEEIEATRQALRLIESRGFSRGKNLLDEFEMDMQKYKGTGE